MENHKHLRFTCVESREALDCPVLGPMVLTPTELLGLSADLVGLDPWYLQAPSQPQPIQTHDHGRVGSQQSLPVTPPRHQSPLIRKFESVI